MKYIGLFDEKEDIVTKEKLEAVASRVSTNEDNIAMAESDIDGLQTTVGTLQTNVTNVQTALTSKQDTVVGGASTITEDNLTASRALVSNSSGKVAVSDVTSTELGYLDGVTSNVQTQLNGKQSTITVNGIIKGDGAGNLSAQDTIAAELVDLPTVPTKVSELTNDANYITAAQAPVQSVNNKIGAVSLTASDVSAIPSTLTGTAGQVLTKTADGQEWADVPVDESNVLLADTNIKLPLSSQCNAIAYGGGKFVAVSYGSTAAYSVNGINWAETTLPSTANRKSVTYGNGKFVTVDYHGNVTYSTDGVNWTVVEPPTTANWDSIAYGGGKFVAVAVMNSMMYSTDGISWTDVRISNYPYTVAYGNGKFVVASANNVKAKYSSDGINWEYSDEVSKGSWDTITYGDDKFVAIGNSSTAIYSTDGINWTTTTLPLDVPWSSITYGNGKFVAVNRTNNTAIYSTDAINWTQVTMPLNTGLEVITYGGGKFIAASRSDSNNIVAYSTDGITWSSTTKALQYPDGTDIHEQVKEALQLPEIPSLPTATKITLTVAGWDSTAKTQSVTVTGVSADATKQEIRVMPVNAALDSPYIAAGVQCIAQAANSLTFACETVPTVDIEVYVVIQGVDYSAS